MQWDESKHPRDRQGKFTTADYKSMSIDELKEISIVSPSGANSGASSGAYNDENDKDGRKRRRHAKAYYQSIKNSNIEKIVEKIAKNASGGRIMKLILILIVEIMELLPAILFTAILFFINPVVGTLFALFCVFLMIVTAIFAIKHFRKTEM